MLKSRDGITIVVNSNGQHILEKNKIDQLIYLLQQKGFILKWSPYLYRKDSPFSANDVQKARIMMQFYKDKSVKAIFDISGGDLANGVID